MLENLLSGWKGKIFVLILLGFAATDFVITMTLSAADAAQHAVENPLLHSIVGDNRIGLTIAMLTLLAIVFLKGFNEAIGLAITVVIPYLLLNLAVIFRCLLEILQHPALLSGWQDSLRVRGDWTMLLIGSALIFPRLALGMSGFETGVSVMPLIDGGHERATGHPPARRIQSTNSIMRSC